MKKERRGETEEQWKGVRKGEREHNKLKEVPSGRWYYEVSLYCRPVVLSVFVLICIIIKWVEQRKE